MASVSPLAADSAAFPLIELVGASKRFKKNLDLLALVSDLLAGHANRGVVDAVANIDVTIFEGESVALVGESGCGKSTLGRIIAGLLQPTEGRRLWRGSDMAEVTGENAREAQLKMQMIFQDNGAALNPRMRIVDIIGEAPVLHGLIGVRQQIEYVGLQLNRVGMDPTLMRRLPHQFPAAHRLRIAIARALAVKPELLVLDEPLAMLDVSMRAQLENLLLDLRTALALTYVHITRDLALARHASERVMIMYRGRIVELGPTQEVLVLPNHPYTRALVLAEKLEVDEKPAADNGRAPSRNGTASGCVFRSHCPYAMPRCEEASPPLEQIAPGRWSACYLNTSP